MFARIKASVARAEIERKGARQRRAQQQRAELGRAPSGVRLTGYNRDGSVNEDEAPLVKELFTRFHAGDSLKALAADLETRGLRTRSGRPWNPSTVHTVLTNPRYAGWSAHRGDIVVKDGERVRGAWVPLVSEGVWESVRARLADPARVSNRAGTHRRHLGSGLYLWGPATSRCGRGRGMATAVRLGTSRGHRFKSTPWCWRRWRNDWRGRPRQPAAQPWRRESPRRSGGRYRATAPPRGRGERLRRGPDRRA